MKEKKHLIEEKIKSRIREVNGTIVQEGMPLTKELKQKLYNCLSGKTTYENERK